MVGGGSVWCGGFCGQIMCFQDREDKRISPSKQSIFVGDTEVNLANQRSVRVAGTVRYAELLRCRHHQPGQSRLITAG
jgi:hypothetical protein